MIGRPGRVVQLCAVMGIVAVVALGCGGGDGDEGATIGATGRITVHADEFEFDPSTIRASDGSFTVVLVNDGHMEHDFLIEGVDDPADSPDGVIYADPGETDEGDYNLDDGTYTFYCSIPGHRQAGMEGTLTVG